MVREEGIASRGSAPVAEKHQQKRGGWGGVGLLLKFNIVFSQSNEME
jgi:hypothetical protein